MATKSLSYMLQIMPAGTPSHPNKIPQFQPYHPAKNSYCPSVEVLSAKDDAFNFNYLYI